MLKIVLLLFCRPGDAGWGMADAPRERGVRRSEIDLRRRVCARRDEGGRRGVAERLEEVDRDDGGRDRHRRALVLPRVGDVDLGRKRVREGDGLLDVELLERRGEVEVRQRVVEVAVDALGLVAEVDGGVGVVLEADGLGAGLLGRHLRPAQELVEVLVRLPLDAVERKAALVVVREADRKERPVVVERDRVALERDGAERVELAEDEQQRARRVLHGDRDPLLDKRLEKDKVPADPDELEPPRDRVVVKEAHVLRRKVEHPVVRQKALKHRRRLRVALVRHAKGSPS